MGVKVQNLCQRKEFDFTNERTDAVAATISIVVLRSVDVTYGETAELCVRLHAHTNSEASNKIRVTARPVSLTPEEPDVDFLADEVAIVDLATHATGTLLLDSFTEPFGNAIQLRVEGIKGQTDGTLKATISVDLVQRD